MWQIKRNRKKYGILLKLLNLTSFFPLLHNIFDAIVTGNEL